MGKHVQTQCETGERQTGDQQETRIESRVPGHPACKTNGTQVKDRRGKKRKITRPRAARSPRVGEKWETSVAFFGAKHPK